MCIKLSTNFVLWQSKNDFFFFSGPTMAFVCNTIKFGRTPQILDQLLRFCIVKMEKLDLLYLSVKYQNVENTNLVLRKLIKTPFSRKSDQLDIGWRMAGGDSACHSSCTYILEGPLPAGPIDKPSTGGNSHPQCQCCDGWMAWCHLPRACGPVQLCCLPYP